MVPAGVSCHHARHLFFMELTYNLSFRLRLLNRHSVGKPFAIYISNEKKHSR